MKNWEKYTDTMLTPEIKKDSRSIVSPRFSGRGDKINFVSLH